MALPWLRLYTEIQDNHKINTMPENMRWRWVMLMCSARKTDNSGKLNDDQLAFNWRISIEELLETKKLFVSKGLVSKDWIIPDWEIHQPPSDSSASRSKKSREKQRVVQHIDTLQARSGDGVDKKRIEPVWPREAEEDYRASY